MSMLCWKQAWPSVGQNKWWYNIVLRWNYNCVLRKSINFLVKAVLGKEPTNRKKVICKSRLAWLGEK